MLFFASFFIVFVGFCRFFVGFCWFLLFFPELSQKNAFDIFLNQARPLKLKKLIEINGVVPCLNQTHPSKPREIKKKRLWEILKPDQSVAITEFLKKISIQKFWRKTPLLKSKKTYKQMFSDILEASPSVKSQGA